MNSKEASRQAERILAKQSINYPLKGTVDAVKWFCEIHSNIVCMILNGKERSIREYIDFFKRRKV